MRSASPGPRALLACAAVTALGLAALIAAPRPAAASTGCPTVGNPQVPTGSVHLIVPAYFSPSGPGLAVWEQMVRTSPRGTVVIANVDSGPGVGVDPNFTCVIALARHAGDDVIGYVNSADQSGNRCTLAPVSEVERGVAAWRSLYGVRRIFLDDVCGTAADLADYREIVARVPDHSRIEVLNPGDEPSRGYFALAPIVVTYEGPLAQYADNPVRSPGPAAAANIVLGVTGSGQPDAQLDRVRARGARYVYVTNLADDRASGFNPYAALPSYYAAEARWAS